MIQTKNSTMCDETSFWNRTKSLKVINIKSAKSDIIKVNSATAVNIIGLQ